MRMRRAVRVPLLLLVLTVGIVSHAGAAIDVQLVASGVPFIVDIQHAGDNANRLFLTSQSGKLLIYDGEQVLPTPFLDISNLITFGGEQGLLGVAFHPSYSVNGFFYVHYSDVSGDTVVARYRASSAPNVADPASGTILLTENQPFSNHNGGQLRFGPDGFLYLALGDGGSGGDPLNNGQRLDTILGKILRIDVDSASPYAIPPTNPFVNTPGARGEIWSYGLRNPWRFSFDRQTGDLFIADVGQSAWEEISFQAAGSGGDNYGWRLMEGLHCFEPSTGCGSGSLTLPVVEYPHSLGCSVTGGFRYRGTALAGYVGTYLFSDYCSGRIWGAAPDANGVWKATQLLDTDRNVATMGEDAAGELYVAHHGASGQLYRLVPSTLAQPMLTIVKAGSGAGQVTSSPASLHCGSICGARLAGGTVVTLTTTPDPGSAFAAWSGDADCEDGAVTVSTDRICIATFGAAFTDEPIVPGTTIVKAVHVAELRFRIGALRADARLSPFSWTNPIPTAGSSLVRAVDILEMRIALDQVYTASGQEAPTYTDPLLASGAAIKAVHISDLRTAVLNLE